MNNAEEILKRPSPSYYQPLELARKWVRTGGAQRQEAVKLLQGLRARYQHVLAIGQELVFALLQENRQADAEAELDELDHQFPELDEETLCRRGRCRKEAADTALAANDLSHAEAQYRLALDCYGQAYELRHSHYPGINKATILLLLAGVTLARGKPEECRDFQSQADTLARDLLARYERNEWPTTFDDDNIWHLLTLSEVYLLLRQWSDAQRAYRRAFAESNVQPFHRETAGRQARRIRDTWRRLNGESDASEFPLEALFAPPSAGDKANALSS